MSLLRRRFLASAAACVSLPWLASLERPASATDVVRPGRFVAMYAPNGMHMASWTPSHASLSPILQPLADVRDEVDVVSGLYNAAADIDTAGHHACGTAGFLTGRQAHRSESQLHLGVSLDVLVDPRALTLGLDDGQAYGDCDNGFSCAYSRNISWRDESSPRPKIVDPRVAFESLFTGFDPRATAADRIRRGVHRHSVLDAVADQAGALRGRLGRDDLPIFDRYLHDVRALELRLQDDPICDARAPAEPIDLESHADAMLELIVTALRCDMTRAATLMLDNSASDRVYTTLGHTHGHHELSHTAEALGRTDDLVKVGAWQVQRFADLVGRLRDESLLGDTMVLLSSELSDGNRHEHDDLPTLVAGGRALGRTPGRHLAFPGADWGDLLLSIGHRVGLQLERFGEFGTRLLPGV